MARPAIAASARLATAAAIMEDFAERTGVSSARPQRRYLWTDAYAVQNDLALARITGERRFVDRALALVSAVHGVLGSHRGDDGRSGPLGEPGHPTAGGLRIGKELPERRVDEPFDPGLEWDRDGQYFHYAMRWARALVAVARDTERREMLEWARELVDVQHRAFTHGPPGARVMFWKMSIDLSRPLVRSMGQHDPLDGYVTCARLEAETPPGRSLVEAAKDFATMIEPEALPSADPLGIGALLADAAELLEIGRDAQLVAWLLDAAAVGTAHYAASLGPRSAAQGRLAFRELGVCIGLHALDRARPKLGRSEPVRNALATLDRHRAMADALEAHWIAPAQRKAITEGGHEDIDEVMLATSLLTGVV